MKTSEMVEVKRVTVEDNLLSVAESIVGSEWGKDNEMDDYDETALREYVANPDNILLIAYVDGRVAGISLAMKLLKPYTGNQHWLYIDEVDVHPNYRKQGIGTMMMKKLLEIGKEWGLDEAWVGTEPDNKGGNSLYKSLNPDETEEFIGYTYKLRSDGK